MFEGKFYNYVDGVAMGSPLGPVLANHFMGYQEQECLQSFEEYEVIFLYRRYVDDIICLFNSRSDIDKYLFFSKSTTSPKIKFTIEKQNKNQLSFLDALIVSKGDNFLTSVYCKSTPLIHTLTIQVLCLFS